MNTESEEFAEVVKSTYWRREDAELIVAAWRSSRESLAAFGRRWSLDPRRISRWAHKLSDSETSDAVTFYPVQLKAVALERNGLAWVGEVRRGEWAVRVPTGFAASEMSRLLTVIAEVESC